jgi:hypothetical protein
MWQAEATTYDEFHAIGANTVIAPNSSTRKIDLNEGGRERAGNDLHLEQRLLQAAEALLAHRGRRVMSVTFPGSEPPLFVVIGETPQLAELLAAVTREVRGED